MPRLQLTARRAPGRAAARAKPNPWHWAELGSSLGGGRERAATGDTGAACRERLACREWGEGSFEGVREGEVLGWRRLRERVRKVRRVTRVILRARVVREEWGESGEPAGRPHSQVRPAGGLGKGVWTGGIGRVAT